MTQAAKAPGRVLVVDDDRSVCTLVDRVLSARGWSVTLAPSAEDADDLVVLSDWDAVLIDKNLPRTSGLEFAERVRARQPAAGIVLMTAQPDAAMRKGAYDAYLPTPFRSLDELAASVVAAQERRRRNLQVDELKQKLVTVTSSLTPPPLRRS